MLVSKDELKSKLDEFKANIKFPELSPPEEIQELLLLSREDFKKRGIDTLAIDSIRLSQYCLFLQIQKNKLKTGIDWCDLNLNSILGRDLPNAKGYGFQEKSLVIFKNDNTAKELIMLKNEWESKLTSIQDIDKKIEFMINSIKNLYFVKRETNGS